MLIEGGGHLKRAAVVLEPTTSRYQFLKLPTVAPVVSNPQVCRPGGAKECPREGARVSLDSAMRLTLRTRRRSGPGRNTSDGGGTARASNANRVLEKAREDLKWGPVAMGSTKIMRVPDSESGSKMGWPCCHGDTMIHFTYKNTDL